MDSAHTWDGVSGLLSDCLDGNSAESTNAVPSVMSPLPPPPPPADQYIDRYPPHSLDAHDVGNEPVVAGRDTSIDLLAAVWMAVDSESGSSGAPPPDEAMDIPEELLAAVNAGLPGPPLSPPTAQPLADPTQLLCSPEPLLELGEASGSPPPPLPLLWPAQADPTQLLDFVVDDTCPPSLPPSWLAQADPLWPTTTDPSPSDVATQTPWRVAIIPDDEGPTSVAARHTATAATSPPPPPDSKAAETQTHVLRKGTQTSPRSRQSLFDMDKPRRLVQDPDRAAAAAEMVGHSRRRGRRKKKNTSTNMGKLPPFTTQRPPLP